MEHPGQTPMVVVVVVVELSAWSVAVLFGHCD